MLELKKITKDYISGDLTVNALKGIDVSFRNSEFVAVLGQSGCGKTTMLNIVGGLDRYTKGDLIINSRSTKSFKPYDWDSYRNSYVGFVFQSYNLIPHQTVLGNVELALTLTGESKAVRREKAKKALERVGLKDQINKRPNQLSGGQMQRVAIARAIVNDPSIILADEPTGALDSKTSIQVLDLLKEIASDRLVIMVTHNDELAKKYSTRIVRLLDGEIIDDTNPYAPTDEERSEALLKDNPYLTDEEAKEILAKTSTAEKAEKPSADSVKATKPTAVKSETQAKSTSDKAKKALEKKRLKEKRRALKHTSMKLTTALSLSGRNLLTKKGRTFMISLAGSIGIIGIALVLAISNGFSGYITKMQADMLSGVPITVSQQFLDIAALIESGGPQSTETELEKFTEEDTISIYTPGRVLQFHLNLITEDYVDYVLKFDQNKTIDIIKNHRIEPNLVYKSSSGIKKITSSTTRSSTGAPWQELIKNSDFLNTQYDVLDGKMPEFNENAEYAEVALVVDEYNRLTSDVITSLGLTLRNGDFTFSDFIGLEYMLLGNDNYFEKDANGEWQEKSDADLLTAYSNKNEKDIKIKIAGILRVKESAPMSLYNSGLVYPQGLTQKIIEINKTSDIVTEQNKELEKGFAGLYLFPEMNNTGKTFAEIVSSSLASTLSSSGGGGMSSTDLIPLLIHLDKIDDTDAYLDAVATDLLPIVLPQMLPSFGMDYSVYEMLPPAQKAQIDEAVKASLIPLIAPSAEMLKTEENYNTINATLFHEQMKVINLMGGSSVPVGLTIYPLDFETKDELTAYMNAYNNNRADNQKVYFSDTLAIIGSTMNDLVNIISYVLIAFAAISLVVSSIMIAIITYVSVIERTKEIGVLRSIGARKKDITRVFNAETIIIGLIAGLLGVAVSYILTIPINAIINMVIRNSGSGFVLSSNLASLNPLHALALVVISVVLTLISGLVPAFMAAKKDPVVALRSE